MMMAKQSIIFQSAKLGDIPKIQEELEWAEKLLDQLRVGKPPPDVGRIYGVSGGALSALAFAFALSAQMDDAHWGMAGAALTDFSSFLSAALSHHLRSFNINPIYGPYNLTPLRRWATNRMQAYAGREDLHFSDLPVRLYLTAMDRDGTFTLFGPADNTLQFQYQWVPVGPPQDALILDGLIAALSTVLSTEPLLVNEAWYRDCRPAIVDAGAIVVDLEAADPRPILRTRPFTPLLNWKSNWFTSSFIMHRYHERNQTFLATYYLDVMTRQRELQTRLDDLTELKTQPQAPSVHHISLPYVGSTEAFTNMRTSVAHKDELMEKFRGLLHGQLDTIPFDQPANLLYGAGGFSGILAGLVTTRAIDEGFKRGGGEIQQVYGVSAGVLNGFFHAVQLAAARYPDLYRPPAHNALADLEAFVAAITPQKVAKLNKNPFRLWQGWGNLSPLESFLLERLAAYTGSAHPEQIQFDDIALPMTVTATRRDGFTEFFGMIGPDRQMIFAGEQIEMRPAYIVKALIAGWSMNTYIEPAKIDGEYYEDGGGAFYDIGLFVACLDPQLTNLINIHLDEPEGHSYNLPPRPHFVRIVFDTHNYYFPEERRRMFYLTNLLYTHYAHRAVYAAHLSDSTLSLPVLPPDFRRSWEPDNQYYEVI